MVDVLHEPEWAAFEAKHFTSLLKSNMCPCYWMAEVEERRRAAKRRSRLDLGGVGWFSFQKRWQVSWGRGENIHQMLTTLMSGGVGV